MIQPGQTCFFSYLNFNPFAYNSLLLLTTDY